jgi:hypothetical protein
MTRADPTPAIFELDIYDSCCIPQWGGEKVGLCLISRCLIDTAVRYGRLCHP